MRLLFEMGALRKDVHLTLIGAFEYNDMYIVGINIFTYSKYMCIYIYIRILGIYHVSLPTSHRFPLDHRIHNIP